MWVDALDGLVYQNTDAATWSGVPLGTQGPLQNSQCSLDPSASSVQAVGDTLTVTLALTFQVAFTGTKNIYGYAQTLEGQNSGWRLLGTWTPH